MAWIFVTLALAAARPTDPEVHLREARRAMRADDWAGMKQAAEQALALPGDHATQARLLIALAHQLGGRPAVALPLFEDALALEPDSPLRLQLLFGVAECHAALGSPREALRWLKRANKLEPEAESDQAKLAVSEAHWRLQRGREKRWLPRLLDTLDATPHDLATLQQARARTDLVERWLDTADRLGVSDPVWLERRAVLLDGAQKQLRATIDHDHHEWTLRQIQRLGQSWEVLGDDVITASGAPGQVSSAELRKAETAWVKAVRLYDMGVRHAARTSRDELAIGMEVSLALVTAKVDGLAERRASTADAR